MSSNPHPRLTCRLVRLRSALLGESSPSSSHVAGCADCQAFFAMDARLVQTLRREAIIQRQPAADDLAARIAVAVREATPQPTRKHRSGLLIAGACLTGLAVILVAVVQTSRSTSRGTSPGSAEINQQDLAALAANVVDLRGRLTASIEPSIKRLRHQDPLAQEVASVQADAKSALDFLARNFLPSDSDRPLKPTPDLGRS